MTNELLSIAASFAKEYCNDAIYPAHLFKATIHKEMGLVHFLETDLGKDYYYLQDWADVQMTLLPRATRPTADVVPNDEAQAVLDEADNFAERFGQDETTPVCVLAALATPGVGFTFDQLKTLPLTTAEICDKMGGTAAPAVSPDVSHPYLDGPTSGEKGNLAKYCIDKIAEIRGGKRKAVVGFEQEISTFYEILGRKTKANLLISGDAGIGKTTLIDGFLNQLADGSVPSFLQGAQAYELDTAALTAGASYKGEVDDRFKKVLKELQPMENAILIIEGIDKLFDRQDNLFGTSTLLKQELSKGNLLLICTATTDGYTKHLETDKEFSGSMERIILEEPTADQSLRILKGVMPEYEAFHHLTVDEEVMDNAIRLAKRYLTEKALPTSAIDLIDRTLSLLKTMNDMTESDLAHYEEQLAAIVKEAEGREAADAVVLKDLEWLNYEIHNKTNCILMAQLDSDTDFAKIATTAGRIDCIRKTLDRLAELAKDKRTALASGDLYAVVAKQTGIPLGKVQVKERDRLLGAEDTLKKRVVGQDHAVKKVLDAVQT